MTSTRKRPKAKAVKRRMVKPKLVKAGGKDGGAGHDGGLTDREILEAARRAVPQRMHGTGQIVRQPLRRAATAERAPDLAADVAKLVGAKLRPADPSEVVVRFTDETELGKRYRLVHLRGGKVTNVVTRAAR